MKKHQNRLSCYLGGPMEFTLDEGLPWRIEFQKELAAIGVDCILPNEEEKKFINSQEEFNKLKTTNITEYIKIMRQFIEQDLKFVNEVDLLVINWTGEKMSGTIGEAQEAYLNNCPVYLVTNQPVEEIPGWFLACCAKVFRSLNQLINYLKY